jgi:hypothetical protein
MPARLSDSRIALVRELLATGTLPVPEIARLALVSQTTVRRIAGEDLSPPARYERCPTCGGHVIMPCVLCGLRSGQRTRRIKRSRTPEPSAEIELGLKPEHQARYEQVRIDHQLTEELTGPREFRPAIPVIEIAGTKRRRVAGSFAAL